MLSERGEGRECLAFWGEGCGDVVWFLGEGKAAGVCWSLGNRYSLFFKCPQEFCSCSLPWDWCFFLRVMMSSRVDPIW